MGLEFRVVLFRSKTVNYEKAIEEVKKSYPELFEGSTGKNNTGNKHNPPRGGNGGGASKIGSRLGKERAEASKNKTQNPFFKN